jgi:Aminoglycoside adenylyltransferase, C-terminal domain
MLPPTERGPSEDAVRQRAEADEAAIEQQIAALGEEIAALERSLSEVRQFRVMLTTYAQQARSDAATEAHVEPGERPTSALVLEEDRAGALHGADHPGMATPSPDDAPPGANSVTTADLRAAVRGRLPKWTAWLDEVTSPNRPAPRQSDMAYAVRAACHYLCILDTNEPIGEDRAVEWALGSLPQPWRSTVERSTAWRTHDVVDETVSAEVRRFVTWAAGRARTATRYLDADADGMLDTRDRLY